MKNSGVTDVGVFVLGVDVVDAAAASTTAEAEYDDGFDREIDAKCPQNIAVIAA